MKSPSKDFASTQIDEKVSSCWQFKNISNLPLTISFDRFNVFSEKKKTFKEIEIAKMKNLIFKKKKNQTGFLIVDITDCIISIVENNHIGHGLQFTKASFQFLIFGSHILDWFESLKKYCYQTEFSNKYELLTLINRGSLYKLYDAINIYEQTNYTVKVYEKQLLTKQSDIDAIKKEISIFRLMNHPGVVNLIEVFENEQGYLIVYDSFEGGTLSDMIKKYQIPEQQAIKIIFRLLDSLSYIHEQSVLHRNLKPENILVKNVLAPNNVQISDFSLADFFRRDNKYLFTRCGTPGYVAPEILQDKSYDFKVDVYSLGVILYTMLSGGASPFPTKSYDERIFLNYNGQIDFSIIDASPDALDLLKQMLEINPQKRINSFKAIWHPVFKGLHKLKITSLDQEKRNSSIKLTIKQSLPPKTLENLKLIPCPINILPPASVQFQRRQKFRIAMKNNRLTLSKASSPFMSPGRNLFTMQSQKPLFKNLSEKETTQIY
ncbi:unnamed protein product [Paramecium octaurelia]|uniref:non-specific serine/threonine protein kinase n=1 Tax=Paramecium octaurelia TaxID=43137 RepID=A0A8S1XRB1_PAROT|nr:unnamed protein product [Paramecium octaurelia]